jgi:hypothetical protein
MASSSSWRSRRLDAAVATLNRFPWKSRRLELVLPPPQNLFSEDGLSTTHSHPFTAESRFRQAYQRAVQATGFDYRIRWRTHTLLWAAQLAAARDGVFVECGTGRGFMMSALCSYLGWSERPLYLFDTFKPTFPNEEGVQAADGPVAPAYAHGPEAVAANFAEWPGVRLVVGEIPATLEQEQIEQVAFLHIDMNHPLPEEAAVRYFWPRLVSGAAMVVDDYGFEANERQRKVHDQLARELDFSILTLPTGQGLAIKGP